MYWRSSTIWKNCWEGFIWIVTRWDIIFQSQTQKLEPPHKSPSFQSVVPYRFLYLFYMSMVSNIILWYSHVLFKHILALPIVHAVMICPITHEFLIPEVNLLPVFYMYSIKTVGEWTIINLKNFRFLYLPTLTPVGWKLRSHAGSRLRANFSHLIEKCELLPSCLTQFPKIW